MVDKIKKFNMEDNCNLVQFIRTDLPYKNRDLFAKNCASDPRSSRNFLSANKCENPIFTKINAT